MGFKVGLLGLGTVGAGFAAIFQDRDGRHPLLQALELHRVGLRSPAIQSDKFQSQ